MLPLLVGIGILGGLVKWGIHEANNPPPKRDVDKEKRKLLWLKAKGKWTLDEAEDTRVLARRYGDAATEKRAAGVVRGLRKTRLPI